MRDITFPVRSHVEWPETVTSPEMLGLEGFTIGVRKLWDSHEWYGESASRRHLRAERRRYLGEAT
jgi:hypothetical protein